MLADLIFSSLKVSLFSHSLKSSHGQASACLNTTISGGASQRRHQRWWPSGPLSFSLIYFLFYFFSSLFICFLEMTTTHDFYFVLVLISLILGFVDHVKSGDFAWVEFFWVWQIVL